MTNTRNDSGEHRKAKTVENKASYQCDVCNKGFSSSCNLKQHIKTHTGEKSCECDICHKRFSRVANLARHKRTHSGEKPYECDICQTRFTESDNLLKHKKIHTGLKPHECDICKQRFLRLGNLRTHKITHIRDQMLKGYKFDTVGHTCSTPTGCTEHKPYGCDVCKKRFSRTHDLKKHKRTHTGNKPYECDVCKRRFSDSSNFLKHKRTHDSDVAENGFTEPNCSAKPGVPSAGAIPCEYNVKSKEICDEELCSIQAPSTKSCEESTDHHDGETCCERPVRILRKNAFTRQSCSARHDVRATGDIPREYNLNSKEICKQEQEEPCSIQAPSSKGCEKSTSQTCRECPGRENPLTSSGCSPEPGVPVTGMIHREYNVNSKVICKREKEELCSILIPSSKSCEESTGHHDGEGCCECHICQELEKSSGIGYVCSLCNVAFDMHKELIEHMVTHDS